MAKKPKATIEIRDQWLNLKKMKLPGNVNLKVIEETLLLKPANIALEVLLPSGASAPEGFVYSRNAEIRKFRQGVEDKVIEGLKLIVEAREWDAKGDPKGAKQAKDTVKKLNDYLAKALSQYRVILRTVVAKELGGKTKADDLMTMGSSGFSEIDIRVGTFENDTEDEFDSPLLDLSKALKRKGVQYCGVAWKAKACVLSVQRKKPFKNTELKQLRELLSKDAKIAGGRVTMLGAKAAFEFPAGEATPGATKLRKAIKKQAEKNIGVVKPIGVYDPKDDGEEKAKKKEGKQKNAKEK